jgi:hypothetical protein
MNKIFIYSNVRGGDGVAYAMAEDGTVLGSHWCSRESFVHIDLGDGRKDRKEAYQKHYPDGYEIEFIPLSDVTAHAGLIEAYRLNQIQGEEHNQ